MRQKNASANLQSVQKFVAHPIQYYKVSPNTHLGHQVLLLPARSPIGTEALVDILRGECVVHAHQDVLGTKQTNKQTKNPIILIFQINDPGAENVHMAYVDFEELILNDARVAGVWRRVNRTGEHFLVQLSDLARLILLERFGGAYVDTDVVFLRAMPNRTNFMVQG